MICWESHLTSGSENEFEFIRQVHTDSMNKDDYDYKMHGLWSQRKTHSITIVLKIKLFVVGTKKKIDTPVH